MSEPIILPNSSVPQITGVVGCIGLGVGFFLTTFFHLEPSSALLALLLATALPMWFLELMRSANGSFFSLWTIPNKSDLLEKRDNFVAAAFVWLVVLGALQTTAASYINGFFEFIIQWYFLIPLLILHYFLGSEVGRGPNAIGELFRVLGRKSVGPVPWAAIRVHVIKAFFLPMMVTAAHVWVLRTDQSYAQGGSPQWFVIWFAVLYLIDTMFATIGYMTTSKAVGAEVRSSDSTWLGWISALSCYAPFQGYIAVIGLTHYQTSYKWYDWLATSNVWFYVWAAAILFFSTIYAWATIVFGLRFSNLTNRGVITSGPFRYSKHPAYISKNISWWMISVPFFPFLGVRAAIISSFALLFVNFIYFVRAKTEERHMNHDSDYRAYSAWIAKHGLLARVLRVVGLSASKIRRAAPF